MAWDLLKLNKGDICLSQKKSRICQERIRSGQRLGEVYTSVPRQKSLYFDCHSGLDPESSVFPLGQGPSGPEAIWIPARSIPVLSRE